MVTKKDMLGKLSEVMDPELGISIVDLGLIYEINVDKKQKGKKQKARIKMTLTTPACPLASLILSEVQHKLEELKNIDIEVSVVFDPLWNPSMMSKKAKMKLGMI